jgi:hypothetical protein
MCKLAIVKDHLIQYGRGPREWDSLDDEWEEEGENIPWSLTQKWTFKAC